MTENLRESFRIEPDPELEAELFHEGRVAPCRLENLSAGGARAHSTLQMPDGAQCTLGVRLSERLRDSATIPPYVSFLMEVLDSSPGPAGTTTYRLRSTTGPGSTEYETAAKVVFAAQRAARARETGRQVVSPMATDPQRRRRFRLPGSRRFSRRSMRPDQHE